MARQVGGTHYDMEISPIEYIEKNRLDFIQGNLIKYSTRHKRKNKDEDVKKIISYALLSLHYDYGYTEEQLNETLKYFMR